MNEIVTNWIKIKWWHPNQERQSSIRYRWATNDRREVRFSIDWVLNRPCRINNRIIKLDLVQLKCNHHPPNTKWWIRIREANWIPYILVILDIFIINMDRNQTRTINRKMSITTNRIEIALANRWSKVKLTNQMTITINTRSEFHLFSNSVCCRFLLISLNPRLIFKLSSPQALQWTRRWSTGKEKSWNNTWITEDGLSNWSTDYIINETSYE